MKGQECAEYNDAGRENGSHPSDAPMQVRSASRNESGLKHKECCPGRKHNAM
jgi:hypothetical protein